MSFVFSFLLFFVLILVKATCKKFQFRGISLCMTFVAFWFIILFFRGFRFYGLYEASTIIYVYVLVGCLFFALGYNLYGRTQRISQNALSRVNNIHISLNVFYYIALLFAFYIIIKQLIVILPVIIASGIAEGRTEMQLENLFLEGEWAILMNYFARPFVKASLVVMVVNFFRHKMKVYEIVALLIILVVAFASEGGRLLVMDVLFAFVYMFMVNRNIMRRKSKRTVYIVIAIIFSFIIYSTIDRGSAVLGSIYTYYCGGLTFLDQALLNNSQIFDPSLYGLNCYQGLFKPLCGILDYIGIPKPENLILADKFILDAQDTGIFITPNDEINYFMTIFGYAYRDGGLIFISVDLFIYGVLCFVADKRENLHRGDVRWTAIKIVFFYTLLYTMAAAPFATFMPVMTIVYIFVITGKLFSKKECTTKVPSENKLNINTKKI